MISILEQKKQIIRAWADSGLLDGPTRLFNNNLALMLGGEVSILYEAVGPECKVIILTRQIERSMRNIEAMHCL